MTQLRAQVFHGIKWTALSRVYKSLVSILQVAILTRRLSKEDFGLMGIAVLVNAFCGIFVDMGLAAAAMHEQNLTKDKFSSFYWFNIGAGLFFSSFISLCSPLVAKYYGNEELIGIVSLSSLIVFINSFCSLQKTLQQKEMHFGFISATDIIAATIVLIVNIILSNNGYGVYSLVWSSLAGAVFSALAYLWIAFIKEHTVSFHFNVQEVRDALRIGIYQVGSSTLDFVSTEMDSFIISSCMPLETFGIYTLFKNLTRRVYDVINPIVTNVFMPVLSKIQNEKEKVSATYVKIVETIGFVNFPIYGIIAFASNSIISILYGDTYIPYYLVLMCMAFFYAFQSCGNPIGALLVALGRTDKGFYWTIFRIGFTAIYLYIASHFSLEVFSLMVFFMPQLTAYPSWRILLKDTTNISFIESYLLPMKPFLSTVFFFPLLFLDKFMDSPYLGIAIVSISFFLGYLGLNYLFRRRTTIEFYSIMKDFLRIR